MKAFLELDTKRFAIKKKDVEKLKKVSVSHAKRYAEFQKIDNHHMRGRNQYPSTGFHSLVTRKYDRSLDERDNIIKDGSNQKSGQNLNGQSLFDLKYSFSRGSKVLGSIQSIVSMGTIKSNDSSVAQLSPPEKDYADYS